MLTIPRLKTFFRNWALLDDMLPASCGRGGSQVTGALCRGQAGEMIMKYVK